MCGAVTILGTDLSATLSADRRHLRIDWSRQAHSSKNQRKPVRRGGKTRWVISDVAESDRKSLRLVSALLGSAVRDGSLFGGNEVGVRIEVDKTEKRTRITVSDLGPRGVTKGRRRDIHGGIELIMDALEGIAFDDDCQVRRVEAVYVEPGSLGPVGGVP
jgi:hypothetical protein